MTTATRIREIAASERCTIHEDGTILFPDPWGRASLSIAIEDAFGLDDIPEEEAAQCVSVDDWAALVERMK